MIKRYTNLRIRYLAMGHSAVTCAKITEPIVMQFGLWAWSGSRNHELDGVQIPTRSNFGERVAHCKV